MHPLECAWVPLWRGITREQLRGQRNSLLDPHDKEAGARLRNEEGGVYHNSADTVLRFAKRRADRPEVLPVMRSKRAAHVFEHDNWRSATLFGKAPHQRPKRPKCARTIPIQPCATTGQR